MFASIFVIWTVNSEFVARQRRDIRRGVQERDEVLTLGAAGPLAEGFDGHKRAQFLRSGKGEQLVRGQALFGRAFPELPGQALGHLDSQRAHRSFSISLRKSDDLTAATPHFSVPRKSARFQDAVV